MKSGDVVKLKSGGPKMTIEHVTDNLVPVATCVWFDSEVCPVYHRQVFRVTSLVAVT